MLYVWVPIMCIIYQSTKKLGYEIIPSLTFADLPLLGIRLAGSMKEVRL